MHILTHVGVVVLNVHKIHFRKLKQYKTINMIKIPLKIRIYVWELLHVSYAKSKISPK